LWLRRVWRWWFWLWCWCRFKPLRGFVFWNSDKAMYCA
jgi:hypothetical protein